VVAGIKHSTCRRGRPCSHHLTQDRGIAETGEMGLQASPDCLLSRHAERHLNTPPRSVYLQALQSFYAAFVGRACDCVPDAFRALR
jgi:hypothetical protein